MEVAEITRHIPAIGRLACIRMRNFGYRTEWRKKISGFSELANSLHQTLEFPLYRGGCKNRVVCWLDSKFVWVRQNGRHHYRCEMVAETETASAWFISRWEGAVC